MAQRDDRAGDIRIRYAQVAAERETILRWANSEEESFGRTLDRGSQLLDRLIADALAANTSWISADAVAGSAVRVPTMAMPPSLRWVLNRLPMRKEEKARLEREEIEKILQELKNQ